MEFYPRYIPNMAFSFPVSFKEFVKDPVKAMLFLCVIAIMYLYIDNKMVYKTEIDQQAKQIQMLQNRVDTLENKLIEINTKL